MSNRPKLGINVTMTSLVSGGLSVTLTLIEIIHLPFTRLFPSGERVLIYALEAIKVERCKEFVYY
jgi:hypothetical protein